MHTEFLSKRAISRFFTRFSETIMPIGRSSVAAALFFLSAAGRIGAQESVPTLAHGIVGSVDASWPARLADWLRVHGLLNPTH